MKKLLIIILTFVICISLTSCLKDESQVVAEKYMSAYSRGDVETVRSLSTRDAFWIASYLEKVINEYPEALEIITPYELVGYYVGESKSLYLFEYYDFMYDDMIIVHIELIKRYGDWKVNNIY